MTVLQDNSYFLVKYTTHCKVTFTLLKKGPKSSRIRTLDNFLQRKACWKSALLCRKLSCPLTSAVITLVHLVESSPLYYINRELHVRCDLPQSNGWCCIQNLVAADARVNQWCLLKLLDWWIGNALRKSNIIIIMRRRKCSLSLVMSTAQRQIVFVIPLLLQNGPVRH